MVPPTNAQLQESLRQAEVKFMEAVVTGSVSLTDFRNEWSTLQRQIEAKQRSSLLDQETSSLAYTLSHDIEFLVNHFSELEVATSSLSSQLVSQLESVLNTNIPLLKSPPNPSIYIKSSPPNSSRIHKPSLQSLRHPTIAPIAPTFAILPSLNPCGAPSVTEPSRSASDPNPLPEFIEHAHKFFVANISNPYPTRMEKKAIVDKTNDSRVTIKSVSNWFNTARRRCGWLEILKQRCGGNRIKMLDLATRVFIRPDPRNPVDPKVMIEMMRMKEKLESMGVPNTHTSGSLEEVIPILEEDQQGAEKRQTEEEREAHRKQDGLQKKQGQHKMQATEVGKKQGEEEKQENGKNKEASFITSYPPTTLDEGDPGSELANCLRSSSSPHTVTLSPSSALEIPTPFPYSFTFDPLTTGLTYDSGSIFELFTNTNEEFVAPLPLGRDGLHDIDDSDITTHEHVTTNIASVLSTSLLPPIPSDSGSRQTSFAPVDLDSVLDLGNISPHTVHNTQPDTSLSSDLEVNIFDWSRYLDPPSSSQVPSGPADSSADKPFQWYAEEHQPSTFGVSEPNTDAQFGGLSFDMSTSNLNTPHAALVTNSGSQPEEKHDLDFNSLLSCIMSEDALNSMGVMFSEPTQLDPSQSSSVSQAWTPTSATLSETSPTLAESAQKALDKELKRKEIAEKMAELDRERARLAEMERELECD